MSTAWPQSLGTKTTWPRTPRAAFTTCIENGYVLTIHCYKYAQKVYYGKWLLSNRPAVGTNPQPVAILWRADLAGVLEEGDGLQPPRAQPGQDLSEKGV